LGDFALLKNECFDILNAKKLFVFDMDGTIYLGNNIFPFAVKFINNLRKAGKKVLFFTNNASHTCDFYIEKLTKAGFSPQADEILTSGDVTAQFLIENRPASRVYLLGAPELAEDFKRKGIFLLNGDEESADIVVSSFDISLTYKKLSNACRFIFGGAEYLSTHPDNTCPVENGFIPDSGAISACITAATGVPPKFFGKPCALTVDAIEKHTGIQREDICFFGDRLYTDIAVATRNAKDGKRGTGVLVLTGETKKEDIEGSSDIPDLVFESLDSVNDLMFG
jgi:HAD superfamily hydrolase (TIGR01450 family)